MTKLGDISTEITAPDDDDLLYIWDASAAAGSRDAKIKIDNIVKSITVAPGWHGIVGDGATDDSGAFTTLIAALSDGDIVHVKTGTYLLDSDIDFGSKHIILMVDGNASFTGDGDILGAKYTTPTYTQGMKVYGKITMRGETDNAESKTGFSDADLAAAAQALRIDNKSTAGTCLVFLSNDERIPVLGDPIYSNAQGVYVTLHSHTGQTDDVAKVWGYNPVVVKDKTIAAATTGYSLVAGIEVSVSNNTAEAEAPGANGSVNGYWASYIHTSGNASAAFYCGGLAAGSGIGWKHGIYIDGLDTASGIGIKLNDDVSPNAGMAIGIDLSSVASFATAAVKFGNNHPVVWQASAGTLRTCLNVTTGNVFEVGNANLTTKINGLGALRLASTIATTTSATAGSQTLPANPVGFLSITLDDGSTTYKIPFYNA